MCVCVCVRVCACVCDDDDDDDDDAAHKLNDFVSRANSFLEICPSLSVFDLSECMKLETY